jgi:hypothetical protein
MDLSSHFIQLDLQSTTSLDSSINFSGFVEEDHTKQHAEEKFPPIRTLTSAQYAKLTSAHVCCSRVHSSSEL